MSQPRSPRRERARARCRLSRRPAWPDAATGSPPPSFPGLAGTPRPNHGGCQTAAGPGAGDGPGCPARRKCRPRRPRPRGRRAAPRGGAGPRRRVMDSSRSPRPHPGQRQGHRLGVATAGGASPRTGPGGSFLQAAPPPRRAAVGARSRFRPGPGGRRRPGRGAGPRPGPATGVEWASREGPGPGRVSAPRSAGTSAWRTRPQGRARVRARPPAPPRPGRAAGTGSPLPEPARRPAVPPAPSLPGSPCGPFRLRLRGRGLRLGARGRRGPAGGGGPPSSVRRWQQGHLGVEGQGPLGVLQRAGRPRG